MSTSTVWIAVAAAILLLGLVIVLLLRLLTPKRPRPKAGNARPFIAETADETMVISREQADDMLNK